jgi:hypothetical protein
MFICVVYVTCGDFHDESEKGTASVHQILCQPWEKTLTVIQQAFGDQILSPTQVFQWHARFKTSCTSVDGEHTGRPTSCTTPETVALIQELIHQDRCWTIHDIAEEVEIGYGTCQCVLKKELGMHRLTAKFVPRILTADQKQQRVDVYTEHRQLTFDNETLLSGVITVDLAPCEFFLFPKMKLKLKGCQLDTTEETQAESQKVRDTLTEKDFQEALQKWRRQWDRVKMQEGTTSRVVVADSFMVSFMIFTASVWNIFDITTYLRSGECSG